MKVTQINKTTRPDLFQVPVDVDGETVMADCRHNLQFATPSISRRAKGGVQDVRIYTDNQVLYFTPDGETTPIRIAEQLVFLESSLDGVTWTRHGGAPSVELPESGRVRARVAGDDNNELLVDAKWRPSDAKQTWTGSRPGYLVRIAWVITRHVETEDLILDYSDYTGNVADSDWVDGVRTIVFEPDGVQDSIEVGV